MLAPGLHNLFELLSDPSPKVRVVNTWVFTRICEHHASVLHNEDVLKVFLDKVNTLLGDEAKIAQHACYIMQHLSASFRPSDPTMQKNMFSPFFEFFWNTGYKLAFNFTQESIQVNLNVAAFSMI